MADPPRTVLITGAAGKIGRCLRKGLHERYQLRLLDVAEQSRARSREKTLRLDLGDREATARALIGCDAVVHLAAIPHDAPFDDLLEANIAAAFSVFEGAQRAGVRRVVLASTNHVTGFYPVDKTVDPDSPVRPDSTYAVTKVFGEALGRLYADKHGLEVVCLRIGAYTDRPRDEHERALWLSPRDCVHLFERALEAQGVGFLVVYGTSANGRRWYDTAGWELLAYRPQDDADRFAGELVGRSTRSFEWQGGGFAEPRQGRDDAGGTRTAVSGLERPSCSTLTRPPATPRAETDA